MDNNYSLKYNKYQQKYLVSQLGGYRDDYSRRGGYEGGYRDDYSRRGGYDGDNDGYRDDYSRRGGYDGNNDGYSNNYDNRYNGGGYDLLKLGFRDRINNVIKYYNDKLWKEQNIKSTRFNYHESGKNLTTRFNWIENEVNITCYVISYNGFPYEIFIYENKGKECYKRCKNFVNEYGFKYNGRYFGLMNKPSDADNNYDYNMRVELREKYLKECLLETMTLEEINREDKLAKERYNAYYSYPGMGGYDGSEYRDDYYPRRSRKNGGRYDRYRDDYYPDSMHGGALGEFRKEINREI